MRSRRGACRSGSKRGQDSNEPKRLQHHVAQVVALSACDEDGALLFRDKKDVAALLDKNGEVLEKIALKACEFNGISKSDDEAKN